jgi:hypothetical protein
MADEDTHVYETATEGGETEYYETDHDAETDAEDTGAGAGAADTAGIATLVKEFVQVDDAAAENRKRVKELKQRIQEWMLDHLPEGQREIKITGGKITVKDRVKKETVNREYVSGKISAFCAKHGIADSAAEELVKDIYEGREELGAEPALRRSKQRARKAGKPE